MPNDKEIRHTHTQGPWHVQKSDYDDTGLLVKQIPGDVVAICDPLPAMEANARLIAAAPALLEAVERTLEWLNATPYDIDPAGLSPRLADAVRLEQFIRGMLAEAIARATGSDHA